MKKIGLLAVLLCLLALGGCDNAKETLSQMRAELRQDILNEETPNQTTNADSAQNSEENLQVPDAKDITIEETYQTVQTVAQTSGEEMSVVLYFADENGEKLVKCEKKIPKAEGIARAAMEALLVGPDDTVLKSAIPVGTELLDINVKAAEKLCIVDLSSEFKQVKDAAAADLAVYAVVDTLCQFETVDKVEIRVEGENISSLGGSADLKKTVKANYSLVK